MNNVLASGRAWLREQRRAWYSDLVTYYQDGTSYGPLLAAQAEDTAEIEAGDIILQADRKPVGSVKDVSSALRDGKALLYIERGPQRFFKSIVRTK